MKDYNLFEFCHNEKYQLMLDMTKELRNKEDTESIVTRFSTIDIKDFFDTCHEHELDGVVGSLALSLGLELPSYWEEEYKRQKNRQEFLKDKAKEICSLMDDHGISMIILKNGGIMISMIPDAVKCPMEDIDSLIRKDDFYKAHEILIKNGFTFKFRSEYEAEKLSEAYRHGSAEYFILLPDGDKMWFELSWRAIDGRWIRPDLEPDTNGFISRSFVPQGTHAHVLSPEDNLLQVCIHTAKHSYCRAPGLRLHTDVDRIIAHNKIDWNLFLKKVRATHVCRSTYVSLYIPSVLFGTDIPEWVLNELHSKGTDKILKMLAHVGLPHPHEKKFNKLTFLRFQTTLYDSKSDMWHTLYPNKQWMMDHYGCHNNIDVFKATIIRGLDLVGIRKKK